MPESAEYPMIIGMSNITNLADSPQYQKETLKLIEKSFQYSSPFKFDVDFAPLYNERNFKNCHILLENDEVIGHIGCLQKDIELLSKHKVNMFGGIVIKDEYRGQGKFNLLFSHVLSLYSEACLSFLWSEKLALYERFHFYPCVNLIHYLKSEKPFGSNWHETKLASLTSEDLRQLKELYSASDEIRISRSEKDWEELALITSARLFIKKQGNKIKNYFFIDKGQDLTEIIHEYGKIDDHELSEMINIGNVWTPYISEKNFSCRELFGSVAKIESANAFKTFLAEFAGAEFISQTDQEITIKIDDEEFTLKVKDFLPGLFGPGKFTEFETPDLFISGLDSI